MGQLRKNTKNLLGFRSGKLTVIAYAGRGSDRQALWRCKCDCGKETVVCGSSLTHYRTRSCGCLKRARYCGKISGKFYIAQYLHETPEHSDGYLCMCACGKKMLVNLPRQIDGYDCGCGTRNSFCSSGGAGKVGVARKIYELFYGVKLTRNDVLVFLDNNKDNIRIDNLRAVKREVYNKITSRGVTDAGLKTLMIDNAELNVKIEEILRSL